MPHATNLTSTVPPYKYDPRDLSINQATTKDKAKLKPGQPSTLQLQQQDDPQSLLSQTTTRASGDLLGSSYELQQQQPPGASKQPRVWNDQNTEVNPSRRPVFLKAGGEWEASKLPGLLTESKALPLTAPGAYTAAGTLRGSLGVIGPKAIAAIHTYHDVSPAEHTECAHDAVAWAPHTSQTWDDTVQSYGTARLHENVSSSQQQQTDSLEAAGQIMMLTSRGAQVDELSSFFADGPMSLGASMAAKTLNTTAFNSTAAPGHKQTADARTASANTFWSRVQGHDSLQLKSSDINRAFDNVSKHAVPGGHNTHLVAGRWKYLERPMVGTPLYTDYYGRFNNDSGNYYGRSWHHVPQ